MGKLLKTGIYTPLFLFVFGITYFSTFGKHVILYQNDVHLFLYTSEYLKSLMNNMPGGISEWLSAFFTQFYFYPVLGVFLISILLLLNWIVSRYMFSFYGLKYDLGVSVVIYGSLFGIVQYFESSLVPVVTVLINLSFLFLTLRIKNNWVRFITEIIAAAVLYFLTGGYFAIFIAVLFVAELLLFNGKARFINATGIFALGIYIPDFVATHFYFLFGPDAYKYPVVTEAHFYGYSFAAIIFALFLLVLLAGISGNKKYREKLHTLKKYTVPLFLTGTIVYVVYLYNPIVAKLVYFSQIGRHASIENSYTLKPSKLWDEVLELSKNDNGKGSLYPYYTNMALSYKGKLLDDMMKYDQQRGIAGLYYPWLKNSRMHEHGGLFYYTIGYVNEAHHWAYESMVNTGPVAPVLKELTVYNLVLGKTSGAKKYLNVLKQSLFYKNWAEKFLKLTNDTSRLNSLEWVKAKRKQIPHGDYFVDGYGILWNLKTLVKANPDNKVAFDYLIAYHLLDGRPSKILKKIDMFKNFYRTLPRLVKEALVLLPDFPAGLKPQYYELARYIDARNKMLTLKKGKERFEKTYSKTYWYYIDFVSPHHKLKK